MKRGGPPAAPAIGLKKAAQSALHTHERSGGPINFPLEDANASPCYRDLRPDSVAHAKTGKV